MALKFSVVERYVCFSVVVHVTRLSLRQRIAFSNLDNGCHQESLLWSDPALLAAGHPPFLQSKGHFLSLDTCNEASRKYFATAKSAYSMSFSCSTALVLQVSTRWHVSLERVLFTSKTCLSLIKAFPSTLASSKPISNLNNVLKAKYTTPKSILWQ